VRVYFCRHVRACVGVCGRVRACAGVCGRVWACAGVCGRVFGREGYLEVAGAGDDVRFREALNWAGWRGIEEVLLEGGRRGYIGATGASGV
jgi:hypothetical protein